MSRTILRLGAVALVLAGTALAACSDTSGPGTGTLKVQLTDAPFSSDSVSRVDIFVVRVDARVESADSTSAAQGATDDSASTGGWTTIATPKQKIELLALRNGVFTTLGAKTLTAGS